ncbi:MAG: hypothetical protein WCV67_04665 [Victivallaceae bacterium]|jgi:hypothetical protein
MLLKKKSRNQWLNIRYGRLSIITGNNGNKYYGKKKPGAFEGSGFECF